MGKVLLQPVGHDDPVEIELEQTDGPCVGQYLVRIGSMQTTVEHGCLDETAGWIRSRGATHSYYAVRNGSTVEAWMGGKRYRLELVDRGRRRAKGDVAVATRTDLTAPMPGTVLKIHVQAGDSFDAHQPLIIMESMKMEMTLSSPHTGRVKEILCEIGELVPMGRLLARWEPVEPHG
jgi:biotin carboxyl carrier protein